MHRMPFAARSTRVALMAALVGLTLVLTACGPRHGTALVVTGKLPPELKANDRDEIGKRMARVLGLRVDYLGVRSKVEIAANGKWIVKLPDLPVKTMDDIRHVLTQPGRLEFRRVSQTPTIEGFDTYLKGHEIMTLNTRLGAETVYVKRTPEMTGSMIKDAFARPNLHGDPEIIIEFTSEGRKRFAEVTRSIAEEGTQRGLPALLAIVIDGKLMSTPVVREQIDSDAAQITGKYSDKEAMDLAFLINNSLPVPVEISGEQKF